MRLSSKLALALLGCASLVLFFLVSGVTGRNDPPAAVARTGTFRLAMIQVSYSDATGHIFSLEQLRTAGDEINAYFDWLSYGNLDFRVRMMPVTVPNTRAFYWSDCAPDGADTRDPCPPPLIQDAAEAAAAAGLDFSDIDGIMLVNPWCQGDWTNGPIDIDRPGVRGRFQRSYDFECPTPAGDPRNPPGASACGGAPGSTSSATSSSSPMGSTRSIPAASERLRSDGQLLPVPRERLRTYTAGRG